MLKIGITANVNLGKPNKYSHTLANVVPSEFIEIVTKHQHLPIILPVTPAALAPALLATVDAVIIPGGQDISPQFFNADPDVKIKDDYAPHDEFELAVIHAAVQQHKPILGVCRGNQLINVAFGGDLYQDIEEQFPTQVIQHEQNARGDLPTHHINVKSGSFLSHSLGETAFVNSRHHQALRSIAPQLHVVATANDHVPEAVEDDSGMIMGVQWHPEDLWKTDGQQEKLFTDFFVRASKVFEKSKV